MYDLPTIGEYISDDDRNHTALSRAVLSSDVLTPLSILRSV
jgi:hypothetical protein